MVRRIINAYGSLARRGRRAASPERGQLIVMSALLIPILLGMAAMAVDIGNYASERRSLQNAADGIALAAGRDLPNSTSAQAAASAWAVKNGVDPANMTVTVSGGTTTPSVRVVISKSHSFAFIKVLGIKSRAIGAVAAAGKFSIGGQPGIVPWGVTQASLNASSPGTLVTLKYDSNNVSNGNFGIIDIDGNGSSVYQDGVTYGSSSSACASGTPLCTKSSCTSGSFPTACAENASSCVGPDCTPETGNKVGATRSAVDFRMNYTSTTCDSFGEVFTAVSAIADSLDGADRFVVASAFGGAGGGLPSRHDSPSFKQPTNTPQPTNTATATRTPTRTNTPAATSTPVSATSTPAATSTPGTPTVVPTATPGGTQYTLNQNCNPWGSGAGACPPAPSTALCSRRVLIVPIINGFNNGSSTDMTIQSFALFFLEGYSGSCTGNSCDIRGEFVNAQLTTGAIAAAYNPSASVQFVKLTE
jgi:hypothetical protein